METVEVVYDSKSREFSGIPKKFWIVAFEALKAVGLEKISGNYEFKFSTNGIDISACVTGFISGTLNREFQVSEGEFTIRKNENDITVVEYPDGRTIPYHEMPEWWRQNISKVINGEDMLFN